ncbi:hypothetical protein Kfla_1950 [Kribbella flavida DSM 17836]|uniref:Uncharacterized protein n=1 Tax=Kribbella flavida (strain DSM 17836 / JCM 10339 / NBRC 14399) TaxID=479435 RepID=D2PQR1_KRIFD|nr:hypothetical protein [Kribbella flavida]ADB31044.1 hypothetical protein Kfla_1950 [Kribbella flavida DSM 17836]
MDARVKSLAVVATTAGGAVLRKVLNRAPSGWPSTEHADPERWRVVTVYRSIDEIGETLPEPLAELGDEIEVRLTPAPGDKGTEVAARLRSATGQDSADKLRTLRRALRDAKQILEVGWVLEPGRHTTTQPTALNEPLRKATAHAKEEGVL